MIGIREILLIPAMVVLPCLGLLVVAAIIVGVIALTRKNRNNSG